MREKGGIKMNNVVLIGRLARDPEIRYTESELAITRFSLAVNRNYPKQREGEKTADFISIIAFGKTAENIDKFMKKGDQLALSGHIQTGSYTNKDGIKVYTTDVVAERIEFLSNKSQNKEDMSDGFEELEKEEIPF